MGRLLGILAAILLFAGAAPAVVLRTITIDAGFTDWDFVLADDDNVVFDPYRNAGDGDSATIPSDPDDIRLIGATWDATYFYFYFQTSKANSSSLTFLVYVDGDHDGKMENSSSPDRVLSYKFVSSGIQSVMLKTYNPANPSGDTLGGDGVSMPGSFTDMGAPSSMTGAISSTGVEYEARISWSDLGLASQTATLLKVSTQGGSNILDNTGLLDLLVPDISITPADQWISTEPNSVVQFTETVTNLSTGTDILNITASSSQGFSITFARWNGSAWVEMLDADNNGVPDLGSMNARSSVLLQLTIFVPATVPTQTLDTITVVALSSVNTSVRGTAKVRIYAGDVTIAPNQEKKTIAGVTVGYGHQIRNFTSGTLNLSLSSSSSQGWATSIYNDTDCNAAGEGSPISSITVGSNNIACIVMQVTVPGGASAGIEDFTTVTVSSSIPALSASTTDRTTVGPAISLEPNNTSTITGPGASTYYKHTISNNQQVSDSFNLTATPSLSGWTAQIYAADGVTPITSIGPVAAYGGTADFMVKVIASSAAPVGSTDVTTVTASSQTGPAQASVTDTTTIQQLATYLNFGATFPSTEFSACTAVYAKGYSLDGTDFRMRWYDSNNVLKSEITGIRPNANGALIDSYKLQANDPLGAWKVDLSKKTGSGYGSPIATANFNVVNSGAIQNLFTNRSTYFVSGNTITVTAVLKNNNNVPYSNAIIQYVIYKGAGATPANGDIFLKSDGTTGTYDGSIFTHTTLLVDIAAQATVEDVFSIANANFGSGNTGTWRVYAFWKTSCGGNVNDSSSRNVTFQVVDSCLLQPTSVVKPIYVSKSGSDYLITWPTVSDPCFSNYAVLGSTVANPPDWNSLVETKTTATFYLGSLSKAFYQIVIQSIDGSFGPR